MVVVFLSNWLQNKKYETRQRQHGAGEHQRGSGRGSLEEFGVTVVESCWFLAVSKGNTLPETNIAPENRPLEKEIPIGNHHF